jgi:signal peptidase I
MTTIPYQKISFTGYSMYPFLLPGDIILVKECGPEELFRGNIIVYYDTTKNSNIAHRVISKAPLKVKGDNLTFYDNIKLSGENILGKAVYIERGNSLLSIDPFLSTILSFLSSINCTPGIIKSHVFGKPVKWILGKLGRIKR